MCVQCWVLFRDDNSRVRDKTWFIYYLVKSKHFILRTLNVVESVDSTGHYKI